MRNNSITSVTLNRHVNMTRGNRGQSSRASMMPPRQRQRPHRPRRSPHATGLTAERPPKMAMLKHLQGRNSKSSNYSSNNSRCFRPSTQSMRRSSLYIRRSRQCVRRRKAPRGKALDRIILPQDATTIPEVGEDDTTREMTRVCTIECRLSSRESRTRDRMKEDITGTSTPLCPRRSSHRQTVSPRKIVSPPMALVKTTTALSGTLRTVTPVGRVEKICMADRRSSRCARRCASFTGRRQHRTSGGDEYEYGYDYVYEYDYDYDYEYDYDCECMSISMSV